MFDGMSTQELFFLFLAAAAGFLGVRHLIQVLQARQSTPSARAPGEPGSGSAPQRPAHGTAGQASDTSQWFRREADDAPHDDPPHADAPHAAGATDARPAADAAERPWYTVLEVSPTAPMEEIRQAYKRRMRQYHPDRLAGLGDEFLVIAEEKTKEINRAYAQALNGR